MKRETSKEGARSLEQKKKGVDFFSVASVLAALRSRPLPAALGRALRVAPAALDGGGLWACPQSEEMAQRSAEKGQGRRGREGGERRGQLRRGALSKREPGAASGARPRKNLDPLPLFLLLLLLLVVVVVFSSFRCSCWRFDSPLLAISLCCEPLSRERKREERERDLA